MQQQDQIAENALVRRDQQLTRGRQNYFLVGPVCFGAGQMAELRAMVDAESQPAEVIEAGQERVAGSNYQEGRRTRVLSVDPAPHRWVYEITTQCFRSANAHMRCEIVPSMNDPVQLLRYDAGDAAHFRWHADTLPSDLTRKISIVVPLNDPAEYEGGELQFNQGGVLCSVAQLPGRPVAFPSWLIHQVTPVTRGQRYSLVAWIRGPNWR